MNIEKVSTELNELIKEVELSETEEEINGSYIRAREFFRVRAGRESDFYEGFIKIEKLMAGFKKPQILSILRSFELHLKSGIYEDIPQNISKVYVNLERIEDLRKINNPEFDLTKLIKICEELNISFSSGCYLATAMLTRALLDHVSPIFRLKNFAEVANNYSGSKSFKDAMQNLENMSRKIADSFLHEKIRKKESLPNMNQVDFSQGVDLLLAEVVRILA